MIPAPARLRKSKETYTQASTPLHALTLTHAHAETHAHAHARTHTDTHVNERRPHHHCLASRHTLKYDTSSYKICLRRRLSWVTSPDVARKLFSVKNMVGMQIIMGSSPATMPPPQGQKGHWFKLLEDMICKTQKWAHGLKSAPNAKVDWRDANHLPPPKRHTSEQNGRGYHTCVGGDFFSPSKGFRDSSKINRAEPRKNKLRPPQLRQLDQSLDA